MGFCPKAFLFLYSQIWWYQPTVWPLSSFHCREKKHYFCKDLQCAHVWFSSPSSPTGRWYIPTLCQVTWLVLTNWLWSRRGMWHSKPKHTVAAVTVSSGEREGHVCQMVQQGDNGGNINLSPWVTVCAGTLPTHFSHILWAKNKQCTLCFNSTPSPFRLPILHTHSIRIYFYTRKEKRCSLFCFYYPPVISRLVLATEKD